MCIHSQVLRHFSCLFPCYRVPLPFSHPGSGFCRCGQVRLSEASSAHRPRKMHPKPGILLVSLPWFHLGPMVKGAVKKRLSKYKAGRSRLPRRQKPTRAKGFPLAISGGSPAVVHLFGGGSKGTDPSGGEERSCKRGPRGAPEGGREPSAPSRTRPGGLSISKGAKWLQDGERLDPSHTGFPLEHNSLQSLSLLKKYIYSLFPFDQKYLTRLF